MIVADRLRTLREKKKLSQNGHTVPAVETLEKFARALEVPLYELLYEGDEPPQRHPALEIKGTGADSWGSSGKDARYLKQIIRFLSKMGEQDRKLLLYVTAKMAKGKEK
jgi:transcriptional regulator with XRE-family HTH domain